MEVRVHPFSFREFLRHSGAEPDRPFRSLAKAGRSKLDNRLREYLLAGGFPEAQGVPEYDRIRLLRTFADAAVLRDVIERHGVSNPLALLWLERQLLANPGGLFSVQKFYDALRSQGMAVAKGTLHEYLGHLEDAFLVRTLPVHTSSERRRMVNPRKAYPADPGLIRAYDRTGEANWGHALEAAVSVELDRRGADTSYVRTKDGFEVDFFSMTPGGEAMLIQVCADLSDPATRERELRGLESAGREYPKARRLLLTMDATPPEPPLPGNIEWRPAADWLLGE